MTNLFAALLACTAFIINTYITVWLFIVNFIDADKNTPLFFAAEGGHLPCVALLMVNEI